MYYNTAGENKHCRYKGIHFVSLNNYVECKILYTTNVIFVSVGTHIGNCCERREGMLPLHVVEIFALSKYSWLKMNVNHFTCE